MIVPESVTKDAELRLAECIQQIKLKNFKIGDKVVDFTNCEFTVEKITDESVTISDFYGEEFQSCEVNINYFLSEFRLKSKVGNKRNDGLTSDEGKVMDDLVAAWNEFKKLNTTHPSEEHDFNDGIHRCQQVLMNRVLRRDYPNCYPTYYNKQGEK